MGNRESSKMYYQPLWFDQEADCFILWRLNSLVLSKVAYSKQACDNILWSETQIAHEAVGIISYIIKTQEWSRILHLKHHRCHMKYSVLFVHSGNWYLHFPFGACLDVLPWWRMHMLRKTLDAKSPSNSSRLVQENTTHTIRGRFWWLNFLRWSLANRKPALTPCTQFLNK